MIEDKELEIHKVFISIVVEVEATSCEEAELLAFRKLQQKIGANLTVKSKGHAVATVRGFREER